MRTSNLSRGKRHLLLLFLLTANCGWGAELLYFFDPHCGACKAFEREVGSIYHLTAEGKQLPLRPIRFQQGRPPSPAAEPAAEPAVGLAQAVAGTPTFILIDNDNREVARTVGYSSDTLFWMSLTQMLNTYEAAK